MLLLASLVGQTPNYVKVGEKEFEGKDIYSLYQKKGLLYVATNKGVYKQHLNTFNKLPSNSNIQSFFDIKEDNYGRIFCKSLEGEIYEIKNDSLELFYKLKDTYFTNLFYFFFDKKNRLIISGDSIIRVGPKGEENLLNNLVTDYTKHTSIYYSHRTINDQLFFSSAVDDRFAFLYEDGQLKKIAFEFTEGFRGDMFLYQQNGSSYIFNQSGDYYSPTGSHLETRMEKNSSFFTLKMGELLVTSEVGGVKIYTLSKDTLRLSHQFLQNEFISFVYQDRSGSLYLGTFGDGIYIIPYYKQQNITFEETITGLTKNRAQNPVISTNTKQIFEFSDNQPKVIAVNEKKVENLGFSNIPYGNSFQQRQNLIYSSDSLNFGALKHTYLANDSLMLIATNIAVLALQPKFEPPLKNFKPFTQNDKYKLSKYKIPDRYYKVAYDKKNETILAVTQKGVLNLLSKKLYFVEGRPVKAFDIEYYNNQLIFYLSEKIIFVKDKKVLDSLTSKDGLIDGDVIKLLVKDDFLHILTNNGFQSYDLATNKFYNLTKSKGKGDETISYFELISDVFWFSTKHDLYNVPFDLLINKEEVEFNVERLLVNDISVDNTNNIYANNQSNFRFFVSCDDLLKRQDAYFNYQLKGFDKNVRKISALNNEIAYEYLPPGRYQFNLWLTYNNTSSKSYTYNFNILKPFYQRWWFYTIIILLLVLLFYSVAKYRINQINKKNKERLEKEILSKNLLDSELKALRSQMNPHFLFNSLNSIQNLVLKQDVDLSYDYITMFSELVRSTLNYSEQEFIPIEKELRFLKVYLDLEKLRFKDDFEYEINCSDSKSIQIPSILIQPFIENSLKHGLLHKKGKKRIDITFQLTDELICTIRDNGIGREASTKFNQSNNEEHQSFSMSAIDKRLTILSEQYNDVFNYNVHDLYEGDNPIGTEIVLNLPFKKNNVH